MKEKIFKVLIDGMGLITFYKTSKSQRIGYLTNIPAGAIFVSNAQYPLSKFIGFWGMIRYFKWALKNGFRVWCSHAGVCLGYPGTDGSDKYGIIEAQGLGVRYADIHQHLNDNAGLAVFYNKNVTQDQVVKMRRWCYWQIGKPYDFNAFLYFLIGCLKEKKDAYICSELAVLACDELGVECLPGRERAKVHPTELYRYLDSGKGFNAGWRLCYEWNFKKEIDGDK